MSDPTALGTPLDPRSRIMDAVVICVEQAGLGEFSLEDVATEAGVGRATIYRHFRGGRDQLVSETITREVARFWQHLAEAVAPYDTVEDRLVFGLVSARQRLADHDLLQRLLIAEPDRILAELATSELLVISVLADYIRSLLATETLAAGVTLDSAADYLTRMLFSFIGTPGCWDLSDTEQVRVLVRTQFLSGVLAG